jgi:lysophospholipid acyltransferase (LPLAT)-like uncharacterized protein
MKLFFITRVVPFFLQLFIRFVYFTSKKKFHHPKELKDDIYIVSFWHGELLMQAFNYQKIRPNNEIKTIISEHKDGEAITKTMKYLGIGSVRGSSSRGGAKALLGAIKSLKNGNDLAITPDGPRGPRFSVADGIVAIHKKTDAKILAFNCRPSKYWQFNSWDKFIIPKPFGVIDFYVSEPFSVSHLDILDAKEFIKEKLLINAMK